MMAKVSNEIWMRSDANVLRSIAAFVGGRRRSRTHVEKSDLGTVEFSQHSKLETTLDDTLHIYMSQCLNCSYENFLLLISFLFMHIMLLAATRDDDKRKENNAQKK